MINIHILVQEPYWHLLLDISFVQDLGELLEWYEVILVEVCLHDGPLRDADKLLRADVGAHHHRQDGQDLLLDKIEMFRTDDWTLTIDIYEICLH